MLGVPGSIPGRVVTIYFIIAQHSIHSARLILLLILDPITSVIRVLDIDIIKY